MQNFWKIELKKTLIVKDVWVLFMDHYCIDYNSKLVVYSYRLASNAAFITNNSHSSVKKTYKIETSFL